jgi:hypothetical protein
MTRPPMAAARAAAAPTAAAKEAVEAERWEPVDGGFNLVLNPGRLTFINI